MSIPDMNLRYTYSDYYSWDDGERWELIDGIPYAMSPAPTPSHQSICINLIIQIGDYLKGKPCKLFAAPFDVRLNAHREDNTVVQPDLAVICDHSKINDKGCIGAPDFIIEILSPSTAGHDRVVKLQQYLKAGVREYWIVDPDTKIVQIFILEGDRYFTTAYADTDIAPVSVLPGCEIILEDVFDI